MNLEDTIGLWLKDFTSEDQLVDALMLVLERDSDRVKGIQIVLGKELEGEDGFKLASQIRWLDAQLHFVATLKDDADALLDKAEEFYRIPAGRCVPCTNGDGEVIPERGSPTDPEDERWRPKYKELTDADRNVAMASKVAPFRRLRNEYENMHSAIIGRLFRAKDIMDEMRARHRASGIAERSS